MSKATSDCGCNTRKSIRRAARLSALCFIFIIIPNFNVLDLLPDFVAYLILSRIFGRYSEHVPYFSEASDAFLKLTIVTAAKIPASFIMLSNMYTGKDIVPLFTLVFITLELLLLFPAIKNSFAALYYVGERGDCPSTIEPIRLLGHSIRAESLERLAYVFFTVRALFNFIPDTLLMSQSTNDAQLSLRAMFPVTTVALMSLSLVLGIIWMIITRRYVVRIAAEGKLHAAIMSITGEEKLKKIDTGRAVKAMIRALTLLFIAAILCFDVSFSDLGGGVNIIPHFLTAVILVWFAGRHFTKRYVKIAVLAAGALFSTVSVYTHYLSADFLSRYKHSDINHLDAAMDAYSHLKIMSVAESVLMVLLCVFFALGFIGFLKKNTVIGMATSDTSLPDKALSKKITVSGWIFAMMPALISVLKCIEVFVKAEVRYVQTDAIAGVVATSVMPWFGFLILGICAAYALFSYYFTAEVKEEIKMKYSDEEHTFE